MATLNRNPPQPPADGGSGFPLIFELVRTPEYRFFTCRRCSCCVAVPDTFFKKAEVYGLFGTAVNFIEGQPRQEIRGNVRITAADLHCRQCNHRLGTKVINAVSDRHRESRQLFWLTMTEMKYWNGEEEVEATGIEPPNRPRTS